MSRPRTTAPSAARSSKKPSSKTPERQPLRQPSRQPLRQTRPSLHSSVWLWLQRGVLLLIAVVLFFALKWYQELPSYRQLEALGVGSNTRIFARDGTPLSTLTVTLPSGVPVYYSISSLGEAGDNAIKAVVTSEDRRFYDHHGVDLWGLGRGLLRGIKGERVEGGSTLTNQLLKNTLLSDLEGARTLERKAKEWMLSLQVERHFSKEQILTAYLNIVYWGSGGSMDLIGIKAASLAYFGKPPKQLTLGESAFLATLIPNPRRYFDYFDPKNGYRSIMKSLLERMVEDGRITEAQSKAAWLEPLEPRGWQVSYNQSGTVIAAKLINREAKNLRPPSRKAAYFMQQLEIELSSRFGREAVYGGGGLKVISSLDPVAQAAAEQAAKDAFVPKGATLGAVMLDPKSSEVLAMVGQKLEGNTAGLEWNNAAQGQRQVGSTIKPLLYATALELGIPQTHTELDSPVSFACSSCPGGRYEPQNFNNGYTGSQVSLRFALTHSLNLPTLRLAHRIGMDTFVSKLHSLELPVPKNAGLSLAIGTLETSPVKMAAAYGSFANGGLYYHPTYLRRVTDAAGKVLFDLSLREEGTRVWTPTTAYIATDMLQGVVDDLGRRSLAARARIVGRNVAGKTGTSNDVRDLWFVGFTPELVGAVWVGDQNGGVMPSQYNSGAISAPIWRQMVAATLNNTPPQDYLQPSGITYRWLAGRRVAVADITEVVIPDPSVNSSQNNSSQSNSSQVKISAINQTPRANRTSGNYSGNNSSNSRTQSTNTSSNTSSDAVPTLDSSNTVPESIPENLPTQNSNPNPNQNTSIPPSSEARSETPVPQTEPVQTVPTQVPDTLPQSGSSDPQIPPP